tara:strand:- start:459 stop:1184 length:726 start_codon:yes stop_codon:yes gene_type:complete
MIKFLFGLVNIAIIISLLLIVGNLILVLAGVVSFFFPFVFIFFGSLTLSFILDKINTKKENELAREAAIKAEKIALEAEKNILDEINGMMKANEPANKVKSKLKKVRSGKWPDKWAEIKDWIDAKLELEDMERKESLRIAEEKRLEKERKAKEKINKVLDEFCTDDEQMQSYKKGKICLDMHMDVVSLIHGRKYEEKRSISKEKEILKYKYGKYKSSRGNTKYKLQVTYIDDRVDSYKDLD